MAKHSGIMGEMSSAKFKKHITRELKEYLGYIFRDLNPRSPKTTIENLLSYINYRNHGLINARLTGYYDYKCNELGRRVYTGREFIPTKVSITMNIPVTFEYELQSPLSSVE